MSGRVVVVGGGLAGISAALELVDSGFEVSLLEGRPHLGGATYSFRRGGVTLDTGQHVFLRCYSAYRALLDRLGTAEQAPVQPRFDVPVLLAGSDRQARLQRDRLPAPLHLARSMATYPGLSLRDRLQTARTASALRRLDPDDPALDARSFGDWLTAHGVPAVARRTFWDLFTLAALNGMPEDVSLAPAAFVFRRALFDRAAAADLGIPRVPLAELHGKPARALLGRLGVEVRTSCRVSGVRSAKPGLVVELADEPLTADAVVLAVPHSEAAALLAGIGSIDTASWRGLGAEPIVNVHVHYDRTVTDLPFAAVAEGPVQWLFDRTKAVGVEHGQWLSISVSGATDYVDLPTRELRAIFLPALARVLPAVASAQVLDCTVTRERRATFRQAPGTQVLRPPADTGVPGLALAGAWTRTGWPDTMEGAVRSGQTAARVIAAHFAPRSLALVALCALTQHAAMLTSEARS